MQLAVKRLSAVEVDPTRSNQHELNATVLMRQLDFPPERKSGPLTLVMYSGDEAPETFEGGYTFSNVREGKPRAPEYHMYYTSAALPPRAKPGDLLVIFREPGSDELRGVIAAAGTQTEEELLDGLLLNIDAQDMSLKYANAAVSKAQAVTVASALGAMPTTFSATSHPVFASAVAAGTLPATAVMAQAGEELVAASGMTITDPDVRLEAMLAAETELFFAIRDRTGKERLEALTASGASFAAIELFFLKRSQSAKSRRGTSLMLHFGSLLTVEGIQFTPECNTGKPPPADFMIPSCDAYNDSTFPDARLRMVSAKSTLKERWTEVIPEAGRIDEKYLVTLDKKLTDAVIRAMRDEKVRPFMPRAFLTEAYDKRTTRPLLGTVTELVAELRAVL
jgi:restriction endonuclease EcoRII-like protein